MHNQNQPTTPYNPQVQPHATGTQPNNGHNPYEFILQADAKPPKEPTSFVKRLLIAVGGIFLLFALLAVGLSIFLPDKGASEGVVAIAEQQQALSTVAGSIATTANADSVKAYALNTQLTLQTDQKALTSYITSSGTKLDEKKLAASSDSDATAKLDVAKNSPSYNTTAREVLNSALTAYALSLKKTYQETSDPEGKAVLQQAFTNVATLLEQGKLAPTQ